MFDLNQFISEYVTQRPVSMFQKDVDDNREAILDGVKGKTVLVIGGAGSIGSAFICALLRFFPQKLVVVDINENALAELVRNLRSSGEYSIPDDFLTYPMNYHSLSFQKMFRSHNGFDIVANFSAHKHVRSEKDIYSLECLLNNNIVYAKELLDLLTEYPPNAYFCVSTDKAANPVNVMGASKRIMEDLIFSYSGFFPVKTARFANVAFSNASLPDSFLRRIEKLQPLGAPCDVKRFFVSPGESGQICLLACILGKNREIFFPKLNKEQMKSFDAIAVDLLHEKGFAVSECDSERAAIEKAKDLKTGKKEYPVYFSKSDTSGEKEYEESYTEDEKVSLEQFAALGVIAGKEMPDKQRIADFIASLEKQFEESSYEKEKIVRLMECYLPSFHHVETGKSLDEKM